MEIMNEEQKKRLEYRVKHEVCPLIKIKPPEGSYPFCVPEPSSYYCGVDESYLGTAGDMSQATGAICGMSTARRCDKYKKGGDK